VREPFRRALVPLGLVAAGAFALRVVYVLVLATRNPDGGDPLYYHVQANLLANGHGFSEPFTWLQTGDLVPTAIHPPLFSIVLAVPSVLGLDGFLAHKLTACLLGALTVFVIGLIGWEVAGRRAGLIAAALAAVAPNLWVIDGILMPEGLFALTIAVVVLAALRLRRTGSTADAAVLGAAISLAALTRGEAVLLFPLLVLPLVLWLRREDRLRSLAIVFVVGGLVLAPWTVRNLLRFERMVPISTNGEEVLAYANCDEAYHGDFLGFWVFDCKRPVTEGDESEQAAEWRRQGLDYARDHLGRVPVVVAARVGRVFDVFRPLQNTRFSTIEGRDLNVNRWGLAGWALVVPLAVAGAVVARRRSVPLLPFAAPVLMVAVTAAYAYGVVRFRVPAEVVALALAGVAIDALLPRRRAAA
jgi:4-amino-4-deoxy-L-arabinose transferase-like glycosyltransferase